MDRYFWTAFRQNILSAKTRNKFKEVVQIETIAERIDESEYNADIDELVVIIENEVRQEFGNEIYEAWYLHICDGKTYKEVATIEAVSSFAWEDFELNVKEQ